MDFVTTDIVSTVVSIEVVDPNMLSGQFCLHPYVPRVVFFWSILLNILFLLSCFLIGFVKSDYNMSHSSYKVIYENS